MTTQLSTQDNLTAKGLFSREDVKLKFKEMLGRKSQGFITSVLQIVASNSMLQKADPNSIFNAAATAATLDLPINNNLGFAYIVPYNQRFKDEKGNWQSKQVAQFQLGYKGFIQLAQRSGQFKTIAATPIYEGQIVSNNPLTGTEFDFTKGDGKTIVGYASYFKLINGFEKTLYMTLDEMNAHGAKFSKSYANSDSLWKKDPIGMGNKTVIKLLLSKFAPMSIEMQKAILTDQAVINNEEGDNVTYIDNEPEIINKESERLLLMINDCTTVEDLMKLDPDVKALNDEEVTTIYNQRCQEF